MELSDIKNLPSYAKDYKYIVYTAVKDKGYWFYGAYNTMDEATNATVKSSLYLDRGIFVNEIDKKAHWEVCGMFDDFVRCSKCHEHMMPMSNLEHYKFNYCPNCGAEME